MIDDHNDLDKLPEISRTFGTIKEMNLVPSHLRERLGIRKVPLSYVIWENVQPYPVEAQVANRVNGASYAATTE